MPCCSGVCDVWVCDFGYIAVCGDLWSGRDADHDEDMCVILWR